MRLSSSILFSLLSVLPLLAQAAPLEQDNQVAVLKRYASDNGRLRNYARGMGGRRPTTCSNQDDNEGTDDTGSESQAPEGPVESEFGIMLYSSLCFCPVGNIFLFLQSFHSTPACRWPSHLESL